MSLLPTPGSRACCAALLLLAGCGPSASTPETPGADPSVTLPATAEARDSVKASLTTPALDAISTTADSAAARSAVTPR